MNLSVTVLSMKTEFDRDETTQGAVLSAFFYGYIILQIPGGMLVSKYGVKPVASAAFVVKSVLTFLTPFGADITAYLLFSVLLCLGLAQGVMFPAFVVLLKNWSTPESRDRMVAIATTGTETGAILAFAVGGAITDSKILGR